MESSAAVHLRVWKTNRRVTGRNGEGNKMENDKKEEN